MQLHVQSMGHMNLKNNTHRMHHITPFSDEKFINFLGRGTAPPQTSPPSPPSVPRFSRLRRSTCDPQCSSGVDAHVQVRVWMRPGLGSGLRSLLRPADADMDPNPDYNPDSNPYYAYGELTSQILWSRYDRHFVGITEHNVWTS